MNSSGNPSAATATPAEGNFNSAKPNRATTAMINVSRNGLRDRFGRCGNRALIKYGLSTLSFGAAPNVARLSHPRRSTSSAAALSPHTPQKLPAGTSDPQRRHCIRGAASFATSVLIAAVSGGAEGLGRSCRRSACPVRSRGHIPARRYRRRCRPGRCRGKPATGSPRPADRATG